MTNRSSGETGPETEGSSNDLNKALELMKKELGELYSIMVFRKQSPLNLGIPMLRPRWYATSLRY